MYRQRQILAGKTLEVAKYHYSVPENGRSKTRRKKSLETPDSVKRANERKARNNLRHCLNSNFKDGDSFITLTYSDQSLPSTLNQVRDDMAVFLRRLRIKAPGIKYVYVIELDDNDRLHVHIVVDMPASSSLPEECWNKGHVNKEALYGDGQYSGLADYLLKDCDRLKAYAFANGENAKQKYTCSRNLTKPSIITEDISEAKVRSEPERIDGYYIQKDSVYCNVSDDGYLYSGCTYIKL